MDLSGGSLPEPEVAEDCEYNDYDADDVEDVVHMFVSSHVSTVLGGEAGPYGT
jgi:hypothetical protein